MSINCVVLGGVVGRDMEITATKNGKYIGKFSLAVTNGWGENKTTTWVNCLILGERANKLAQHITKGTKLVVNGRLDVRQYDKQDGTKGTSVDVIVNDFEFAGGKAANDGMNQDPKNRNEPEPQPSFDDEIPF